MTDKSVRDVAIIGAGPAGLFAVFQCGMLGLSCHVIDSLAEIGGQCTALYPEKPIYDIPGFPKIDAGKLIENLEEQAAPFNPAYHTGEKIVSISNNDANFELRTDKGQVYSAKTILIAGGAGCFGPNKPPLEGIEQYEGTSVHYMVRQKSLFEGKRVVIAGGGDSAVDWALSLAPLTDKLYVVHRRDKFRAMPESTKKLHDLADNGQLELVVPYQLYALKGDGRTLQSVIVRDLEERERELEADMLLPFFGLAADMGPFAGWGLTLDPGGIVVDPFTHATSVQNIYAIGDIVSYNNKLKLILTGFAEAAQAAHSIYKALHPDVPLHFEYSTTKGLPAA